MADRFVVFDLETTGLSPRRGDRVIEIGAVALEEGRPSAEFHSLVATEQPIHWAARRIHGISARELAGAPLPAEVFPRFHRFIGDASLVAHNFPFDRRFLASEFARLSLSLTNPGFCTLSLGRRCCPGLASHSLESLARHLLGPEALSGCRRHRALDDARLTSLVWLRMGLAGMVRKNGSGV